MDVGATTTESIATPKYSIVMVSSEEEAVFARKFVVDAIGIAFDKLYTAFSTNATTAFLFPNNIGRNVMLEIYQNPDIIKLISKPIGALKSHLRGNKCENCKHISDYINEKGDTRDIPEMKRELMDLGAVQNMDDRVARVALTIMKYKTRADITGKPLKKPRKSFFNKKRDCYLLYLTAYNDILSRLGPMKFITLVSKVRGYPYLCRAKIHPAFALDGLIALGALSSDLRTSIISIPDQLPKQNMKFTLNPNPINLANQTSLIHLK